MSGPAGREGAGPLVFLVAGEPSGDALGARLMAGLKAETDGTVRFAGIGGDAMAAGGLSSLFPMADLSVMGLAEVLPRLPRIVRRLRQAARAVREMRPDVVVTIDSPDFSFRLAKRLRGKGIPLVHYVAPTVWAWRPGRARRIARFLDHLLAVLPFEPPYFEREGLKCTFVGHSVVESGADRADGPAFRRRHGIAGDAPLLCVLPGSRQGEVSRLLPVFGETLERLAVRNPGLRAVLPAAEAVADAVVRAAEGWSLPVIVVRGQDEKYAAFAAADAALAASGTVSLELALAGTPAVIAYKVNAMTAWLVRRMVRIPSVNLVNIVLGRPAVPEFLQEDCRPELLADALGPLLHDGAERRGQVEAAREAMIQLGGDGPPPSRRAARAVLESLR